MCLITTTNKIFRGIFLLVQKQETSTALSRVVFKNGLEANPVLEIDFQRWLETLVASRNVLYFYMCLKSSIISKNMSLFLNVATLSRIWFLEILLSAYWYQVTLDARKSYQLGRGGPSQQKEGPNYLDGYLDYLVVNT